MRKNLSFTLTIIVGLGLTIGLTGCKTSPPKPFEYKEWHNVQINEYGEKCTYTSPQREEDQQIVEDFLIGVIGGVLKVVGLEDEKCRTLVQWRAVEQGTAEMMGLLNSFRSVQGKGPIGIGGTRSTPSLNSNAPSFDSNTPSTYKSSFGTEYQYDLSNPLDRVRYNSDPGAKLRDRITPNPYKDIETNILQKGGGIYPKNNNPTWEPVR
jgi:hypothetical protein